jgi:hypothetical protein
VTPETGELLPGLSSIGRTEERGVLDSGVHGVGIVQRGFEMPDALELPGMGRAIVPLMGAGDAVIHELVADRCPALAAVVGSLHHLPEPAAGLRGVKSAGVGR